MFTEQKVKTPPPDGTSVDPPPPPPPPAKPKPPVPRKPQTKRVSFISEPHETKDRGPRLIHTVHDDEDTTNVACRDRSILIQNRPSKIETNPTIVRPDEFIIPPPPLFATKVSQSQLVHDEHELNVPLITIVPERVVLPEPIVAETAMQSSNSTNSPESEFPPPVNYQAHPILDYSLRLDDPLASPIISEVPLHQVFRTELSSNDDDDCFHELSVSPVGEPGPPELLHAQYKTLPTISHIPNSPCYLHPDKKYFEDTPLETHVSLREMRSKSLSPKMVHSSTYPLSNPYPSLTTVAGTFNPYTCTLPVRVSHEMSYSTSVPQLSPPLVSSVGKDINANVTQSVPIKAGDATKSVQSERRVRFGEVTTAPEFDVNSNSSELTGQGSTSPASTLKPAWSSKMKSFAIGEVNINVRHLTHNTQLLLIVFVDPARQLNTRSVIVPLCYRYRH